MEAFNMRKHRTPITG